MLSRKNKDLRTIKEGVVGKYVKKDTPPEMPIINVWTTEPKRRISNQGRSSLPPNITFTSNSTPQTTVQKFGNQKMTISDVGLGAHEGKYTPSTSVPNLATRFANLSVGLTNSTSDNNALLATNLLSQNNMNSSSQPIYINHPIGGTFYDNSANNANYVEIDQIYPLTQESIIYSQPSYNHLNSPIYQNTTAKTSVMGHTTVQNIPTTIYSNTHLERYHSQPQGISFRGEALTNHMRHSLRSSESNQDSDSREDEDDTHHERHDSDDDE